LSLGSYRAWREADARELLAAHGVPLVPGELVTSVDEAAATARRLGYPVALRISSAGITHKSDIGGVALGLRNITQLRAGFRQVRAAGHAAAARQAAAAGQTMAAGQAAAAGQTMAAGQ